MSSALDHTLQASIDAIDRSKFLGGSTLNAQLQASIDLERLWPKATWVENGCLLWTASVDRHGYGQFRFRGTTYRAHRAAYILLVGEIPDGVDLDHLCKNPRCINPDHLEPVTHAENVARGNAGWNWAAKTCCPKGHEYTPENTLRHCQSGSRVCRTCDLERKRIYNTTYKRKSRAGQQRRKQVANGGL